LAQIARLQLYEECFLWGEVRVSHAANASFSIRLSGFKARYQMDIVRARKSLKKTIKIIAFSAAFFSKNFKGD
jgi:hypothetical protein